MKLQKHCVAALASFILGSSIGQAQDRAKDLSQPVPPQAQKATDQKVKDAAGKNITVGNGSNLTIGPNGHVEFTNQTMTQGSPTAPIMILNAGWIYLYEGGTVYKIRQSDMKLMAKTPIGPDAVIEVPAPRTFEGVPYKSGVKRHATIRRRSKTVRKHSTRKHSSSAKSAPAKSTKKPSHWG